MAGMRTPQPAAGSELLAVTEAALDAVLAARAGEDGGERLALFIEVSGAENGAYTYDIWFEASADASPRDRLEAHGELLVVVPEQSVPRLQGATLDAGPEGLVIVNPNSPPPAPGAELPESYGDLSGPLAAAVLQVLEQDVNPQIAMHGGRADLVGVDEDAVAYLRLSGGCQGCGLAQVTLSQGISVAIQEAVPEISRIVDVTAHGAGTNPYFESAKK